MAMLPRPAPPSTTAHLSRPPRHRPLPCRERNSTAAARTRGPTVRVQAEPSTSWMTASASSSSPRRAQPDRPFRQRPGDQGDRRGDRAPRFPACAIPPWAFAWCRWARSSAATPPPGPRPLARSRQACGLRHGREDTEMDKTMIERLADPLVHLIRNAIDHGIESAADRAQTAKSPTGRNRARGTLCRGSGCWSPFRMTGRAQHLARIRAKAEENGLIAPGAAMSEHDIHHFCSIPGSRPPRPSPRCRAAASAGTWSSARSKRCAHHRPDHHSRPWLVGDAAPAADAGYHRRPAHSGRRGPLHHIPL